MLAAGGLHIVGTERHEARRIDNQLRGRAGRQGDPGAPRFYLSLEDDLMRRFANDRVQGIMRTLGFTDDTALESKMVSRTIESAQSRVEGYNFDTRKHVVEYDDVINRQRETIYRERDRILRSPTSARSSRRCSTTRLPPSSPSTPPATTTTTGTSTGCGRSWPPWSRR